jgi:photosystem II stability/assembly factor-like uncharacterized protein
MAALAAIAAAVLTAGPFQLLAPSFGVAAFGNRVFAHDGGRWRELVLPPPPQPPGITHVLFLDRRHGFVVASDCVGRQGTVVYRTVDGGRSWARYGGAPFVNCAAGSDAYPSFVDPLHGFLIQIFANGPGATLFRTADGGRRWTPVAELERNLPFTGDVAFRTVRDGWLASTLPWSPPNLAVTHDGGRTWRHVDLPAEAGWRGADRYPGLPRFFGTRGVLPVGLVARGVSGVGFYVTVDAGRTWRPAGGYAVAFDERRQPGLMDAPVVAVASSSAWWVVSSFVPVKVAVTTDAGRHWSVHSVPGPPSSWNELGAADGRTAWLRRDDTEALLATSDGGRTWRRLTPPR